MRIAAVWLLPTLLGPLSPPLVAQAPSELRARIEHFDADLRDLARRYDTPMSEQRHARLRARLEQEQRELQALDFDALSRDDRIDWILLDNHVARELQRLDAAAASDRELVADLPFASTIVGFGEGLRRMEPVDPAAAAAALAAVANQVASVQQAWFATPRSKAQPPGRLLVCADRLLALRRTLDAWFRFRDGYDPQFSWWTRQPHRDAGKALEELEQTCRREAARDGDATLVGNPIGEAALLRELRFECIPYSPAELVAIAEREFAWCDAQMAKASDELGCGDDWRRALELVKQRHRAPGEQPALIKALADEAIAFLEQRDLITIPELAKECWRMRMMSAEAQKVNPFFLGGETIAVSFPTDAMSHDEKLQSLRSNNEHFCRATVHHELIPGHWLQQYSQARWRTWRRSFETPFWIEGWALYWEMRLYDLGLGRTPHDRVGMLYWRKHRCARIVFSLNFHLGQWSPAQCVRYLIERVGHEPAAAEGEVRRSIGGGYGPLYQAAYMLGGLQLRALHRELVEQGLAGPSGTWTERAFHDAVLQQNAMPIAVLRLALRPEPPAKAAIGWRFADGGR